VRDRVAEELARRGHPVPIAAVERGLERFGEGVAEIWT
jgi:hypothetical protein